MTSVGAPAIEGLAGLLRGTVIYGVGQAVGRSIALLLLPLLTAVLDPAEYGALSLLMALGWSLNTGFSLGLGAAMTPSYFERTNQEQRDATIWTASTVLAGSSPQ